MEYLKQLTKFVAEYYDVEFYKVFTKCRKRELVTVRQMVMYIARKDTTLSLEVIASYFNRDHATCIHAVKCMENFIKTEKKMQEDYIQLRFRLRRAEVDISNKDLFKPYFCHPVTYAPAV